jgi:hypothetical protein
MSDANYEIEGERRCLGPLLWKIRIRRDRQAWNYRGENQKGSQIAQANQLDQKGNN